MNWDEDEFMDDPYFDDEDYEDEEPVEELENVEESGPSFFPTNKELGIVMSEDPGMIPPMPSLGGKE